MSAFMQATRDEFRRYRQLADRAMAQVEDAGFFGTPDAGTNSMAIIVKHIAGNLRSRWTDFLTTDGEKPDRNRDGEFVLDARDTRESLMERWNAGWTLALDALDGLGDADLERVVYVRGEPHTVPAAVQRQLGHAAYHVGQIVLLARHYAGDGWTTLTIPRGASAAVNERMMRAAPHG